MKIACTADWHIHAFSDFSKQLSVVWDSEINRFVESKSDEAKEIARLQRELRDTKDALEILKKAISILGK